MVSISLKARAMAASSPVAYSSIRLFGASCQRIPQRSWIQPQATPLPP
jgi:hypothetical protein